MCLSCCLVLRLYSKFRVVIIIWFAETVSPFTDMLLFNILQILAWHISFGEILNAAISNARVDNIIYSCKLLHKIYAYIVYMHFISIAEV